MRTVTTNNTLKYHPSYKSHREMATMVHDMLRLAMHHIDKYFDLPDTIRVVIKPLKGSTHGKWLNSKLTMYIDPRAIGGRNLGSILSTFVHELAHAEQYKQGRLEWTKAGYVWNKSEIRGRLANISFKKYYNLPWEIEARQKQDHITPLLAADIAKPYR